MDGNQQGAVNMEMGQMNSGATGTGTRTPPDRDLYPPNTGRKATLPPIKGNQVADEDVAKTNAAADQNKPIVKSNKTKGPDNSLIGFLGNLGIVVLCIINILTFLLGIGLVIIGVYVNNEINKESEIMDLLDKVDFGAFTLKEVILLAIVVIIILGVFAIVTSLIGGCGAFFALRVLTIIYIIILIVCMVLEIGIVGVWIDFLNQIDTTLRGWLNTLLKEYNGPGVANLFSLGWDLIFVVFGCCGVDPITSTQNDFQSIPTVWWTSGDHGNDTIPYSCCQNVAVDSVRNYLNYTDVPCTENLINYNTSGCYDFFSELFKRLASVAITVIVIIFIVEIIAVVFGFVIVCAVSMKKKVGICCVN